VRFHVLVMVLLLAIAVWMRVGRLELAEFNTDEAANMLYAADALDRGGLPLVGRPSGQVNNATPPHSTYVYMAIALFSFDPLVFTGVIAVANAVGVVLLYLLGVRMVGWRAALIGALWYAVDAYAILFSRKIWEPELVAPVFLAALLVGWLGLYEGRRVAQMFVLPLMALTVMLHLSAMPLLAVVPVMVWAGRKRLYFREMGIGVLASVLLVLPFVVGLLLRQVPEGSLNTNDVVEITSVPLQILSDIALGLRYQRWLVWVSNSELLLGLMRFRFVWAVVGGCLLVVGSVALMRLREVRWLVGVWALTSAVVLSAGVILWMPRYLLGAFPAVCLVIGIGGDAVLSAVSRWRGGRVVVVVMLAAALGLKVAAWWTMVDFGARSVVARNFSAIIQSWARVESAIPSGRDVVVVTDGLTVFTDRPALVWTTLLKDRVGCVGIVDNRAVLLIDRPFTLLVTPGETPPDEYVRAAGQVVVVRRHPTEEPYSLYAFERAPEVPTVALPEAVRYENGMQLLGVGVEGGRLRLRWDMPRGNDPASDNYSVYIRFVQRRWRHDRAGGGAVATDAVMVWR
jgi:hypothetical protein